MSASTTQAAAVDDKFIFSINQTNYYFQLSLISLDGEAVQYIKPTAIQSFTIEDNLENPFHSGVIIVDNTMDFLERAATVTNDPSSPSYYNTTQTKPPVSFLLKGESRDILHVDIMPILDPNNPQSLGNEEVQSAFRMAFDFAIINTEEVQGTKPNSKYKKFYLKDLYDELLREKNVPFSTSKYVNNKSIANLDDTERAIPTGFAIQALLGETFPKSDNYPVVISYNDGKSYTYKSIDPITPATITSVDAANYTNVNWDLGGSNIFFSAPPSYKAWDSLMYLMTRHVSNANSNYDQCFLQLERFPRAFSLKSLKQYFDQALIPGTTKSGNLYLETLRIGNLDQDNAQDFAHSIFTPSNGPYFSNIGTIKTYSFDNMSGIISQKELVSNFVHSYEYNGKQFNIDAFRNSLEQSMQTYTKNYVNNMLAGGDTNKPYSNFAPGIIRNTNININNKFSVDDNDANTRLAYGRNKFLFASTLTNNIISFRLKGSTHRQSGHFIGIDRDGAMQENRFDDKLLGIYLIVSVAHVFEGGTYYNDLHCIKTYNNLKQLNTNQDGTLSTIL